MNINSPQFSRNYGFWNESEQQAICDSHVAIAGVGGDGFQLGLKLAMQGVQTFTIADPEVFEPENTNRVPGATQSNYGLKKADVFKSTVIEINPDAEVTIYEEGVTEENVEAFMVGVDLVLDESELTYLHIGTAIARESRKLGIPDMMVMNVGFAAQVTSFHPESRYTFEKFMGIPAGMPLDEVKDMSVSFDRCLPYIPKYGDLRSLAAVQEGASLPSIAQGVDVASAIGSSQAFLHLTSGINNKRQQPVWAPRIAYVDAYNFKSGITRQPRLSHYKHLVHSAARNILALNPLASYTAEDRERRLVNYRV